MASNFDQGMSPAYHDGRTVVGSQMTTAPVRVSQHLEACQCGETWCNTPANRFPGDSTVIEFSHPDNLSGQFSPYTTRVKRRS